MPQPTLQHYYSERRVSVHYKVINRKELSFRQSRIYKLKNYSTKVSTIYYNSSMPNNMKNQDITTQEVLDLFSTNDLEDKDNLTRCEEIEMPMRETTPQPTQMDQEDVLTQLISSDDEPSQMPPPHSKKGKQVLKRTATQSTPTPPPAKKPRKKRTSTSGQTSHTHNAPSTSRPQQYQRKTFIQVVMVYGLLCDDQSGSLGRIGLTVGTGNKRTHAARTSITSGRGSESDEQFPGTSKDISIFDIFEHIIGHPEKHIIVEIYEQRGEGSDRQFLRSLR